MKLIPLDFEIETERLLLRRPLEKDIDFVFEASQYPGFNDGMLWDAPESKEDCMDPHHTHIEQWKCGKGYVFTVTDRSNGAPIGRIAIEESSCGNSIGFWTHPKHQSYGYMTEALEALLRFCFTTLELKVVEACHADWNIASRRVLEKNGFRFRRHLVEGFLKNGEWVPQDVLAITLSQWLAATGEATDRKAG